MFGLFLLKDQGAPHTMSQVAKSSPWEDNHFRILFFQQVSDQAFRQFFSNHYVRCYQLLGGTATASQSAIKLLCWLASSSGIGPNSNLASKGFLQSCTIYITVRSFHRSSPRFKLNLVKPKPSSFSTLVFFLLYQTLWL